MRYWLMFVYMFFLASAGFMNAYSNSETSADEITQTIESQDGSYSVHILPKNKKVEVRQIKGSSSVPPHLRLRILRKDQKPLDVKLHTMSAKEPVYSGRLDAWQGSYVGLELELSFDLKSWKKIH